MKLKRINAATALCSAVILAGSVIFASADEPTANYPEGPVTMIIAWGAGGGTDVVGRAIQQRLGEELGTNIVIRNLQGASGTIGTAEAAEASPDGHTIIVSPAGPMVTQPHLRELPYGIDSFAGLGRLTIAPSLMMVRSDSPFQTVEDVIAAAKENPGGINFASTGPGTLPHISIMALDREASIKSRHVPFGGSADAVRALLGGTVDVFTDQAQIAAQYELRPIAALGPDRMPEYPDVPTLQESGYDIDLSNWVGVFVPAGTSNEIRDVLVDKLSIVMDDPSVIDRFQQLNVTPGWLSGSEFDNFVKAQFDLFSELLSAETSD